MLQTLFWWSPSRTEQTTHLHTTICVLAPHATRTRAWVLFLVLLNCSYLTYECLQNKRSSSDQRYCHWDNHRVIFFQIYTEPWVLLIFQFTTCSFYVIFILFFLTICPFYRERKRKELHFSKNTFQESNNLFFSPCHWNFMDKTILEYVIVPTSLCQHLQSEYWLKYEML